MFFPKTKSGFLSVVLIPIMLFLFWIGFFSARNIYVGQPSGKTIAMDITQRPAVAIPMLAGFISGVLAFAIGIFSIYKKRERAILVFVSTIIGFFLILFLIGEITHPH